ncbi:SOS response-associated peptidase [Nitratireductor sp. XY-223]|uniref:SOS response-associated peptidase n=1 Tax=Nitratireductor sp. XY-223 TaxID=2561926 RepID=UPI0010AB1ED3|nr:SOS response-associated peptidase [Nitratireductor sp. XY-223]
MCGRFITTGTWEEYRKYLSILPPEVDGRNGPQPNYNVAPTSELDIVVRREDEIAIEPFTWGLIPHWAKDSKTRAMINARGETITDKPFFRSAFEHGRCLVPATGYFEWKTMGKEKQPYLIHLPGNAPVFEPFAFAGVMSRNKKLDAATFAIVTLAAGPSVSGLHARMPVVLKNDVLEAWMDPNTDKAGALELLQHNRGADFVYHPVTRAVGNVNNKGPELIDAVDAA